MWKVGTVVKWKPDEAYGFINPDGESGDFFSSIFAPSRGATKSPWANGSALWWEWIGKGGPIADSASVSGFARRCSGSGLVSPQKQQTSFPGLVLLQHCGPCAGAYVAAGMLGCRKPEVYEPVGESSCRAVPDSKIAEEMVDAGDFSVGCFRIGE
jgi:hypothetical protein